MITVNRNGPEQMADNPKPGTRQQYVDRSGEYRPAQPTPPDPRVILARGIVALGLFLVATLVYFAWRIPTCWYAPCAVIRAAEPVAFGAILCGAPTLAALGYGLSWWVRQRNARALERAEIARTALTLDRFGNPVSAMALTALSPEQHAELLWKQLLLATELKRHTAPYEQLPQGLNTLNMTPQALSAPAKIDPAPPMVDVGPLAPEQWLAWLDEQPHALFAASTKKGKSTMAKYGLKPRLEAGESIFVIDPHSSDWFRLPVVGGGEKWLLVEAAMMTVYAEYKNRIAYREQHHRDTGDELPHNYFPRLTVLFDEVNLARFNFGQMYGAKNRNNPWLKFAQCLGSGARKVGISIWLLCQSALVEDLDLSGSMRENFTRIALDEPTIRLMLRGEKPERKAALDQALSGMSFPATASIDADVYLLDRRGIVSVEPPRIATPWAGWDYASNRGIVTLDDDGTVPTQAAMHSAMAHKADSVPVERASHNVMQSIAHNTLNEVQRDELVRILFRKGNTYREVREKLAQAGLSIDQNRLTVLRDEALHTAS